jgi:DNA-binding response OmpR family regulator
LTGETRTILIVEDDPAIGEELANTLRAEGYAVDVVADGASGLAYLETRLPSLILLDMIMPGMTGVEFRSRQMKNAAFSGVPVVLMSAAVTNLSEYAAYLKAADHLEKPIDVGRLYEIVARHTRHGADGSPKI